MSCWAALQIDPTGDKKAIKKAYAVLLKSNKPDENPEGFAALHSAYKACLKQAQFVGESPPDPVVEESRVVDREPVEDPVLIEPKVTTEIADVPEARDTAYVEAGQMVHDDEDEPKHVPRHDGQQDDQLQQYLAALDQSWSRIQADTEAALSELVHADDDTSWRFIETCDELYDFEFKQKYSEYLFLSLLRFIKANEKIKPEKRLNCLRYIDRQLNWSETVDELEVEFGEEDVAYVLYPIISTGPGKPNKIIWRVPKVHPGPIEIANYSNRLMAKVIDLLTLFFFMIPAEKIGKSQQSEGEVFILTFFIFLAVMAILEATPLQGSVGKILLGMKVTDKSGKRLNIFHAFFRQFIFLTNLIGFKVVVWINLLLMRNGYLFHDKLSLSRVINRY